jgi:uncharacterized repeat protein (TIGR01451 family)
MKTRTSTPISVAIASALLLAIPASAPADQLDNWSVRRSQSGGAFDAVTFANGRFATVGFFHFFNWNLGYRSLNGVNWSSFQLNPSYEFFGVTFGNGQYVAVGQSGTINTSPDASSWSDQNSGTGEDLRAVAFGDGKFVAVGVAGTILTSPEAVTWTPRDVPGRPDLFGITYGAGKFVAVGSFDVPDGPAIAVFTSPDGVTWTDRSSGLGLGGFSGVAYHNGAFVAVGRSGFGGLEGGKIFTSVDAVSWTQRDSGTSRFLNAVTAGDGWFVVVGDGGAILTSQTGVSWTPRASGTTQALLGVTFGVSNFVAVGNNQIILQSGGQVPPPCPATQAPVLQLNRPLGNQSVQVNEFILDYEVSTPDPFAQVTWTVTGPDSATRARTFPASNSRFGPIAVTGWLYGGQNTLTLTVRDCFGTTTRTATIHYNPLDPMTRFQIMGIEITQAIQDLNNSVPLIAGKRTLARVYVRTQGPTTTIPNVTGFLSACRPTPGTRFCQSDLGPTLQSLNSITVDSSTDVTVKRRSLDSSLNFELPPEWIAEGRLHVEVGLRAEQTVRLPCDGCGNRDRWGNLAWVYFQDAPPVRLKLVSVPTVEGGVTNLPASADIDLAVSNVRRGFPTSNVQVDQTSLNWSPPPSIDTSNQFKIARELANAVLLVTRELDVSSGIAQEQTKYYGLIGSANWGRGGKAAGIPSAVASGVVGSCDHECGHMYGRYHVEVCGAQGGRSYPYPSGLLSGSDLAHFGFDIGDASVGINRAVLEPDLVSDLMTYCADRWPSDFTYKGILDNLHSIETANRASLVGIASANDPLLVIGTINLDSGQTALNPFSRYPGLRLSARPASSPYSIVLLNGTGGVLASYPFEPKIDADPEPDEDKTAWISEVVQFVEGTRKIVISKNGQELASRLVSLAAPNVINVQVGPQVNGTRILSWDANDADSTNLTFTVQYSADGGTTWQTIAVGLHQRQLQLSVQNLRGSNTGQCRVIVTDGVNTGRADSPPFTVPNKSPRARIISPKNASTFATSQAIVLAGEGLDLEDGSMDGPALQWRSSLQGALGAGRLISIAGLLPGLHTITLTATDRTGAVGQSTIQIQVDAQPAVADAGVDRFVTVGSHVQLDASGSTGSAPLAMAWQIALRPSTSQATVVNSNAVQTEFVADAAGRYEVVLTIKDGAGGGASTLVVITAVDSAAVADLAITGTAPPNPVGAGQMFTYSIAVRNNGPGTATGVTMTDTLPDGLHFVSAPGCSVSGNTVTCSLSNLASGSSATVNITVGVDCAVPDLTSIVNVLTVDTTAPESNVADNTVNLLITAVNPSPSTACLSNSWTGAASGKWEESGRWSLFQPPSSTQSVLITNVGTKAVTIDGATSSNSPDTLTIGTLTLGAPVGVTINTLALNNAGLSTPLHVLSDLQFVNHSALLINNSAVQVDGFLQLAPVPGSSNHIVISNGGRLVSAEAFVGSTYYGDKDSVLVTGTNSIWTNSGRLFVSFVYPNTGVTVAKGGQFVAGSHVYIGHGGNSGGTEALVTDPGSRWANFGTLFIGSSSSSIHFTISNGATAFSANAVIGNLGATNQTVLVTGANSAWRSDGRIQVGQNCSEGSLTVTDGGILIVTNLTHTAVLDVHGGTLAMKDATVIVDKLIVTNACARVSRVGGTLLYNQLVLDPALDADGDGQSNENELLAGTDPLSADSAFRILSAVRTNNDVRVEWTTVGGHSYVMQAATNLAGTATTNFFDLSPVISVGGTNAGTTNFVHAAGGTDAARYYRVRLAP